MKRVCEAVVGAAAVAVAVESSVCDMKNIKGPLCDEQPTYRGDLDPSNFFKSEFECQGQFELLFKRAKDAIEKILGRQLTPDECRESFKEMDMDGKRVMEVDLLQFQSQGLNNFNIGGSTGTAGKVYIDGQGGMKCHTYPNGRFGGNHTAVVKDERVALEEVGNGNIRVVTAKCPSPVTTSTSEAANFASDASGIQEPGPWTKAAIAGALSIVAGRAR